MRFFKGTLLTLGLISFFPTPVSAAIATVGAGPEGFATLPDLVIVFANVVSVVSTFAGFGLLIQFIRGGISYITAQGDPKAVASARSSLTWAVIGVIVILASYLIISLILGFVSLPGIGQFCIPKAGQDVTNQCPLNVKK